MLIAADLKEDSQIEADAANINKGTPDGSIESSDDNSCNTPMSDTVNDRSGWMWYDRFVAHYFILIWKKKLRPHVFFVR